MDVSGTRAQYVLHYMCGVLTSVQGTVGGRDGWDNVVRFAQIKFSDHLLGL